MPGSNPPLASYTPPLAYTPEVESSPSNAPSQHEYTPIAPSTVGSNAGSTVASSINGFGSGPAHIVPQGFMSPNGLNQAIMGQPLPQLPGATVYTPTATPGAELNPRSCVTCRRRKVRCDKHMPCSNCRRALIPCIFPAPERAPRRPRRKDPNALRPLQSTEREIELLKRLRKLEGIVEELSGQVELEATKNSSNAGSPEAHGLVGSGSGAHGGGHGDAHNLGPHGPGSTRSQSSPMLNNLHIGGSPGRLVKATKETERQFGRLVINDYGRSRYVSSAFWSKINDELDELRAEAQRLSEPDSDGSETESSPAHEADDRPEADHHGFIFGFQSTTVDLRPLHPLPSQIPYIWQVFQENVDPMVKVLHIPTTSKLIRNARTNLDGISPAAEALMFAIYYAAVSSLDETEIKVNFLTEKDVLVKKYRFALEQALAKAKLLVSSDMVVLQAFVLYVVLIRRNDETRLAWTMTGLAIRIGHSIGLHRDGTNFPGLTPFEIEMRRRLFWVLCVVDMRSAEDQGTDLAIFERGFDTQLPMNINDADIGPDSKTFATPREGATDTAFSLIRFEICGVARRLHAMHSGMGSTDPAAASVSLAEKERMIRDVYEHVQQKYRLDSGPSADAMSWVATTITRVICAKMTLVIYQPILFPSPGSEDMSRDLRERLFTASTELFEYSHILTTDPRTRQWRWLFKTYMQWHAVAYILMEMARRPWSASVERAWNALTSIISDPKSQDMEKMSDNASIWLPFKMLFNKARKHRDAELARLRNDRDDVIRLDHEDRRRLAPAIFADSDNSLNGYQWRERWLELVGVPELISESPTAESSGAESVCSSASQHEDTVREQQLTEGPIQQNQRALQQQELLPTPNTQQQQNQLDTSNLLDHMFAQRTFESSDLFPVYLENMSDVPKDMAGPSTFGTFGNTGMPRQDASLAAYAASNNGLYGGTNGMGPAPVISAVGSGPGQNGVSSSAAQGPQSETPLVDPMVKEYPPPWFWPQNTQPEPSPQFPALLSDEGDIKMDDFDWQDFGQNLGGMTNGVWSSHGI